MAWRMSFHGLIVILRLRINASPNSRMFENVFLRKQVAREGPLQSGSGSDRAPDGVSIFNNPFDDFLCGKVHPRVIRGRGRVAMRLGSIKEKPANFLFVQNISFR